VVYITKPVAPTFPEDWAQIRNSSPFSQQLTCVDSSLLTDDAFLAPLPLQVNFKNNTVSQDHFLEIFQASYQKLQIIALAGTSFEVPLEPSEFISFIFVNSGQVCVIQNGLRWCSTAGGCLIVSGLSLHWSSSAFSVVCLMFPVDELEKLSETFTRSNSADSQIHSAIVNQRVCIPASEPIVDLLISHLNSSFHTIGQLYGSNLALVLHLDLVGHLYRLLSVLLSRPYISSPYQSILPSTEQVRDSFDDLLEYIQANLHLTLNLSVLERRSNYSRRTLQYAFRNRKGCTATQWIRSCRLELAHQLVLVGSSENSVASIALACGYRSMSLFSIEFQHRFHVKPSHLLRSSQNKLHSQVRSEVNQ